jgi:hypothetical protein
MSLMLVLPKQQVQSLATSADFSTWCYGAMKNDMRMSCFWLSMKLVCMCVGRMRVWVGKSRMNRKTGTAPLES